MPNCCLVPPRLQTRQKGYKKEDVYTGPYLDAQVTGGNYRDKKVAGKPMTFLRSANFEPHMTLSRDHFIPIYEQVHFR